MARIITIFLCLSLPISVVAVERASLHERELYDDRERRVKQVYADAISDYDAAVKQLPGDVVLQIRRCELLQSYSYIDDYYFESIESAAESCFEALREPFAGHPELILSRLERGTFEDALPRAETIHDDGMQFWTQAQHARLHVYIANQIQDSDERESARHCVAALSADSSVDCRLRAARYYLRDGDEQAALDILVSPLDPIKSVYQKTQKMEIFVELDRFDEVARVWASMSSSTIDSYSLMTIAPLLEQAGLTDAAYSALDRVGDDFWDKATLGRVRFSIAVGAGDSDKAYQYYREMRDLGFSADPLLRLRFELAALDHQLPWEWRDLLGLLTIIAALLAMLAVAMILPAMVHYRGLVRRTKNILPGISTGVWTLSHVVYVGFVILFVDFFTLYVLEYDYMLELGGFLASDEKIDYPRLLAYQTCFLAILCVPLVWRQRDRVMLRTKSLTPLRWAGIAIAFAIGMRLIFALPVIIFGEDFSASQTVSTTEIIVRTYLAYGFWPVLFFVAIVTPIVEEIIFRGVLLYGIAKHISFTAANTIQSLLFAVLHDNALLIPWFFTFALLAGVITKRSQSIAPAILGHVIFNAIVIFLIAQQ